MDIFEGLKKMICQGYDKRKEQEREQQQKGQPVKQDYVQEAIDDSLAMGFMLMGDNNHNFF